jgi:hypothetical protein
MLFSSTLSSSSLLEDLWEGERRFRGLMLLAAPFVVPSFLVVVTHSPARDGDRHHPPWQDHQTHSVDVDHSSRSLHGFSFSVGSCQCQRDTSSIATGQILRFTY